MNKTLQQLITLFLVVILLYVLKPILMPLLFSILLAAIVFPVVHFLEKKWHFGHGLTALIGVLVVTGIAVGVVSLVSYELGILAQDKDMYFTRLEDIYLQLLQYIDQNTSLDISFLRDFTLSDPQAFLSKSSDTITQIVGSTSQFLADLFMVPLYIFFILYYRSFLVEFLYRVFVSVSHERMDKVLSGMYDVVRNYLRGLLLVMFIVGVLNSIGLLVLGIDNALFFGFLGALLILVPYIGIIIGSLLPAMVALVTKDSYWYSVGVIGVFVVVQFLEGNFITPRITGSKMSMNALISIISLFIFGMLWGMAGLILALPLTAMLKVIFDHSEEMQAWGFLIGETEDYHTKKHTMAWVKLRMKYHKEAEAKEAAQNDEAEKKQDA